MSGDVVEFAGVYTPNGPTNVLSNLPARSFRLRGTGNGKGTGKVTISE